MDFEAFKKRYQKIPIKKYPNNIHDEPLVSVCVQTYQHTDFIEDCLDGIMMQETHFSFEVLLGEDASTDGTREICIEYAEKYPNKIRLFLHKRENNIEIGGQPSGRFNFLYNLYSAKGKYIALCEGDDYWTDPLKLQKQVDFMEKHVEYSLIHTEHSYKDEKENTLVEARWESRGVDHIEEQNCVPLLLTDEYLIGTSTALMRTALVHQTLNKYGHDFSHKYMMGDIQLWFHMARMGKIKYLEDITAVYRRHAKGVTALYKWEKRIKFIKNVYWAKKSFADRYGYEEVIPVIDKKYLGSLSYLTFRLNTNEKDKYLAKFKELDNVNYALISLYYRLLKNKFPQLKYVAKKLKNMAKKVLRRQ